jgi:hypothetical protein
MRMPRGRRPDRLLQSDEGGLPETLIPSPCIPCANNCAGVDKHYGSIGIIVILQLTF